jgi:solute carrier family 27 (fatty acid transporter), member 1/4
VIKDVFKAGDLYFNSSDILVMDLYGYYYFKDRTGDTFRWKGENVASAEVEGIVMKVAGLSDCVVYGVDVSSHLDLVKDEKVYEVPFQIPELEGKAGMAAIVDPENRIDLDFLASGIKGSLPPYARPVFIRIMPELPMTGTFKLKKRDLQLEGFDLTKITDPIYVVQRDGSYKRLTNESYEEIKSGKAKL